MVGVTFDRIKHVNFLTTYYDVTLSFAITTSTEENLFRVLLQPMSDTLWLVTMAAIIAITVAWTIVHLTKARFLQEITPHISLYDSLMTMTAVALKQSKNDKLSCKKKKKNRCNRVIYRGDTEVDWEIYVVKENYSNTIVT